MLRIFCFAVLVSFGGAETKTKDLYEIKTNGTCDFQILYPSDCSAAATALVNDVPAATEYVRKGATNVYPPTGVAGDQFSGGNACRGRTTLTAPEGIISDGLYTATSAACEWVIQQPADTPSDQKRITLTFSYFETSYNDVLSVYDGESRYHPSVLKRTLRSKYSDVSTLTVTATSGKMFIRFSDDRGSYVGGIRGFSAHYTTPMSKSRGCYIQTPNTSTSSVHFFDPGNSNHEGACSETYPCICRKLIGDVPNHGFVKMTKCSGSVLSYEDCKGAAQELQNEGYEFSKYNKYSYSPTTTEDTRSPTPAPSPSNSTSSLAPLTKSPYNRLNGLFAPEIITTGPPGCSVTDGKFQYNRDTLSTTNCSAALQGCVCKMPFLHSKYGEAPTYGPTTHVPTTATPTYVATKPFCHLRSPLAIDYCKYCFGGDAQIKASVNYTFEQLNQLVDPTQPSGCSASKLGGFTDASDRRAAQSALCHALSTEALSAASFMGECRKVINDIRTTCTADMYMYNKDNKACADNADSKSTKREKCMQLRDKVDYTVYDSGDSVCGAGQNPKGSTKSPELYDSCDNLGLMCSTCDPRVSAADLFSSSYYREDVGLPPKESKTKRISCAAVSAKLKSQKCHRNGRSIKEPVGFDTKDSAWGQTKHNRAEWRNYKWSYRNLQCSRGKPCDNIVLYCENCDDWKIKEDATGTRRKKCQDGNAEVDKILVEMKCQSRCGDVPGFPTSATPTPSPTPSPTPLTSSRAPTRGPTTAPTRGPTFVPTRPPTYTPTFVPTDNSTRTTNQPTPTPSGIPSPRKTPAPTFLPTNTACNEVEHGGVDLTTFMADLAWGQDMAPAGSTALALARREKQGEYVKKTTRFDEYFLACQECMAKGDCSAANQKITKNKCHAKIPSDTSDDREAMGLDQDGPEGGKDDPRILTLVLTCEQQQANQKKRQCPGLKRQCRSCLQANNVMDYTASPTQAPKNPDWTKAKIYTPTPGITFTGSPDVLLPTTNVTRSPTTHSPSVYSPYGYIDVTEGRCDKSLHGSFEAFVMTKTGCEAAAQAYAQFKGFNKYSIATNVVDDPALYSIKTTGYCDTPITSLSDCSAAVTYLTNSKRNQYGLEIGTGTSTGRSIMGSSPPSPQDDGLSKADKPIGCYVDSSRRPKFNHNGNTGQCTGTNPCLCKSVDFADRYSETKPPHCYYDETTKKFYENPGTNKGHCSGSHKCLCRGNTRAPTLSPTPAPTTADSVNKTSAPTYRPTRSPTKAPSPAPSFKTPAPDGKTPGTSAAPSDRTVAPTTKPFPTPAPSFARDFYVTCAVTSQQLNDAGCPQTSCEAVIAEDKKFYDEEVAFNAKKLQCAQRFKGLDKEYVKKLHGVWSENQIKDFAGQMFGSPNSRGLRNSNYYRSLTRITSTPTLYPTYATEAPGTRAPTNVTATSSPATDAPTATYAPNDAKSRPNERNYGKYYGYTVANIEQYSDSNFGCACAMERDAAYAAKETDYDAIVNDTVAALNMQQSKCQDLKAFVCDQANFASDCGPFLFGKENIHNSQVFLLCDGDKVIDCGSTSEDKGLSAGAIAAIIIIPLVIIALLAVGYVLYSKRTAHASSPAGEVDL